MFQRQKAEPQEGWNEDASRAHLGSDIWRSDGQLNSDAATWRNSLYLCYTRAHVTPGPRGKVKARQAVSVSIDRPVGVPAVLQQHWPVAMPLPTVSRLFRSALRTQLVPAANVASKPAKHNISAGVSSCSLWTNITTTSTLIRQGQTALMDHR